jgi:aspartyl-tRNA(Asn)/glutamyl-tRNA(Gln) amidotransferase subunit A
LHAGDAPVDPDVRLSVEQAARTLSALGHSVETGPAPYAPDRIDALWATLSSAGLARVLDKHRDWRQQVSPSSKEIADRGAAVDACKYVTALDEVAALRLEFAEVFDVVDVLLTPTSNALPWSVERPYPAPIDGREAGPRGAAAFATFVNATGLPAVSVPGNPAASGLPIGVQFVGRYGDDATLMALAAEYEEAEPWSERWPAIAAA